MTAAAFAGEARLRTASFADTKWVSHVQLWRPNDPDHVVTGDVETAALLLSGTFDLVGGGTAWPARGARATPFEGRPMAVFLPPRTEFRTQNGRGEILLVAARQPAVREETTGREVLAKKPLLPLAGSGKAFDPNSGEWKPAETFPTAPESLPPRRMERLAAGECTVERVFARDYKAATLSLDEVVVPAGRTLQLASIPGLAPCDEVLVFVRADADALVTAYGAPPVVRGDAAFVLSPQAAEELAITSGGSPTYVVLAYAGKA